MDIWNNKLDTKDNLCRFRSKVNPYGYSCDLITVATLPCRKCYTGGIRRFVPRPDKDRKSFSD